MQHEKLLFKIVWLDLCWKLLLIIMYICLKKKPYLRLNLKI